jgi:NADPH:quinone reductase-like Zn-dependent oxidoreductase
VGTAQSPGADHVIDYTQDDFTRSGHRYDLIFAANAYHSIFDYRRALSQEVIYVMAGGGSVPILQTILFGPFVSLIGRKEMRFVGARVAKTDLVLLKNLLEAGRIVPVIDRRYPFSALPDALRYLEEGHARGRVVVAVKHNNGEQSF